ncbi:MAG: hypothetical protein ABW167_04170 [Baekduia sp.]
MLSSRKRVLALIACLVVGALAATAGSASAWSRGNVWVNFGPWNCPSGGSVVGVYWANDVLSVGPPGGDWGDRVIYPSVRIGAANTISYQLMCKKWFYTYRGVVSQRSITPSRSGQSYWF